MRKRTGLGAFAAALICFGALQGCLDGGAEVGELEQEIALPPPANLQVTVISTTGVRVTWDPSPGATKYIVMRGTPPGPTVNFTSWPATSTVFVYNHLAQNTTYCWAVRNVNAMNEVSLPSNEVCVSTGNAPLPPPPQNVTATATSATRITVTWAAVMGATSYQILGAPVPNAPVLVGSTNGATLSFTHANLSPNTTYQYVVRAITPAGTTADSSPPAVATTFAEGLELYWKFEQGQAQSLNDASGFGRTATLAGGAVFSTDRPNVLDDRYTIRLPAGTTSAVTRANTPVFNLGSPFTISLWVKATAAGDLKIMGMRSAGCGALGWEIAQNAANGLYFAGETGGIRSFAGGPLVPGQWTHLAVTGDTAATTLRLYRDGAPAGVFMNYGVGNHLTLPLTVGHVGGCAGGEIFVDEVQLLSRVQTPAEIASIGDLPEPPVNLMITNTTSTRMDLAWTPTPNVAKYIIYRGTAPGNEVFFTSSPAASPTFAYGHLTPSTQYSWQVSAVVGTLISPRSASAVGTTLAPPAAPQNVTATAVSSSRIRVNWDAVPGATSYRVYQSTGGGAFVLKASTASLTATIAGLASMTEYSHYVIAIDAGNTLSPPSATVNATTL